MGKTAETIRQEATKGERNAKRRQEKEYKRQINKSNERDGTLTLGFARPRCSLTARPRKPQGQSYRCNENVMIERQNMSA